MEALPVRLLVVCNAFEEHRNLRGFPGKVPATITWVLKGVTLCHGRNLARIVTMPWWAQRLSIASVGALDCEGKSETHNVSNGAAS